MTMFRFLRKRIKKAFETTESTITSIIFLSLLGGAAAIITFFKKAISLFLQILTTSTPVWATISLVLLGYLYIYFKMRQAHKSQKTLLESPRIEYITIGEHKWHVEILDNRYFYVDKYPYCKKHNLKFIYQDNHIYCPEVIKGNCNSKIYETDRSEIYETAKSYIEKEIRNKHGLALLKKEPLEPVAVGAEPESSRRLSNRQKP